MGTSTSFRSPAVPRWQAFTTALEMDLPIGRVVSELFNAGKDWENAIASPAIAVLAATLVDERDTLVAQVAASERPERALQTFVASALAAGSAIEATAALPLAERALMAVLVRNAAGDEPLSNQSGEVVARRLRSRLSERETIVSSYLGEILAQYARHVTAREFGRLTEGPARVSVSGARRKARGLAAAAEEVGHTVSPQSAEPGRVRDSWPTLVRAAFGKGRELPREPR